jgi:hypothetical protein
MRQIGETDPADPVNAANWSVGGGLPAVARVIRTSDVEFELVLTSPAPVAGGYTVTVAATVENGLGEPMDAGSLTSPAFAVTVADFTVSSITWVTPAEFDIVFSEPYATIEFDEYHEVVRFLAQDTGREPPVIGLNLITLNREVFVSLATNVTLKAGDEEQVEWGQGAAPTIAALTLLEDNAEVTASEVLGDFPQLSGWSLSHGLYGTDKGSLGRETPLELGATDAVLVAPGASFDLGDSVTFSIAKTTRTVEVASSWLAQASSVVGAGSETVGAGVITLDKLSGVPYEVVFSGGTESVTRAGRKVSTTMDITFTPGATSFSLATFTLLNTQISVMVEKTVNDLAQLRIFRGNIDLGIVSREFDPTTAFVLDIIDATQDTEGFLAVAVDGIVLLGARSSDLLDNNLLNQGAGATAVALTLGSPAAPTETFSIEFSTDLVSQTYLSSGFVGRTSKDLFSFGGSSAVAVVGAGASPPLSGGYEGTGRASFGVHAEWIEANDAIQVVIGLNENAQPAQFTGSVSLMTGDEKIMDQVLFDQSYVFVGGNEIGVIFLHPTCWSGALVGVTLEIDGTEYSAIAPVTPIEDTTTVAELVQQPSKWYHPRLPHTVGAANVDGFGPATIIETP